MSDGPIDPSVFAELAEATGAEFAQELLGTFLDEASPLIDELKDAATAADPDRYRRAAHSLKSNAQTFGAQALANLARDLEINGFSTDQNANQMQHAALVGEYERASSALKALTND
ncbi:Hpt domain-containing protein [Shimia sp.]|uniref:Hpt domain-containing protein n=1 Tax=Shimia sp. TaxID=1954381 RepID=UPI0032981C4F